jgi:hypothetical protein
VLSGSALEMLTIIQYDAGVNMEQAQSSWLSLVTFCAVTGLLVALGSAVALAGASLAFAVAQPAPGADANAIPMTSAAQTEIDDRGAASGQTFAGMITDSRCGARHRMNSGKTSAECALSCVRHGAHYVLVDGEKVYALEGHRDQLERLAGERANVVGTLEGDTIKVKAVMTE